MPTTATPCGPARWRAGWRSWGCSDPSPALGQQRQPLLRIAVTHSQVPAGLSQAALPQPGKGLRLGDGFRGLAHPTASQQRYPVHGNRSALQRSGRGNLPPPRSRLRTGTTATPPPLEPLQPQMASTISGVDQSSASRKRHRSCSVGLGRPISGRVSSFLADTGSLTYALSINGRVLIRSC
jgi:hypothetical protein